VSRLAIDDLVCKALATAGLGTYGTDLFRGPVRGIDQDGIPVAAIFVQERGGDAQPMLNATVSGSLYTTPVMVRVRSAQEDYDGGQTTTRAVYDSLHTKNPSGTGNGGCYGGPWGYLGPDKAGNHEWSLNFEVVWAG